MLPFARKPDLSSRCLPSTHYIYLLVATGLYSSFMLLITAALSQGINKIAASDLG